MENTPADLFQKLVVNHKKLVFFFFFFLSRRAKEMIESKSLFQELGKETNAAHMREDRFAKVV